MGLVVATTAGLVVWLVLWALGVKAIDAFMITVLSGAPGRDGPRSSRRICRAIATPDGSASTHGPLRDISALR